MLRATLLRLRPGPVAGGRRALSTYSAVRSIAMDAIGTLLDKKEPSLPNPIPPLRTPHPHPLQGGKGWMESYPWANLAVGFGFGYLGTVFTERNFLKPKQAALH